MLFYDILAGTIFIINLNKLLTSLSSKNDAKAFACRGMPQEKKEGFIKRLATSPFKGTKEFSEQINNGIL